MKVSIITPSYNHADFIERTIRSVLTQDVPSLEFVIFDGGSSDGTRDILERHQDNIKWVSRPDEGQADAVNQGIQATEGDIIGWLNSDDIYYPGAVAEAIKVFSEHPEVDVVYGMADYVDLDDRQFDVYPTEPWDPDWLKERCFICQPALFFRRSVVDRFGLLDASLTYCMDYEYWLRLAAGGAKFFYLPKKLAASRMYPENKTLRAKLAVRKEINSMLRQRLGRVPDPWLYVYAQHRTDLKVERSARPQLYGLLLAAHLVWAAWRWNGGLSADMLRALQGRIARRRTLLSLYQVGSTDYAPCSLIEAFPEGGEIIGLYRDCWAGSNVTLQFGPGRSDRFVDITLGLPTWLPARDVSLTVGDHFGRVLSTHRLLRGSSSKIHLPLGGEIGRLDLSVSPAFRPAESSDFPGTTDTRELTLKVTSIDAGVPNKVTTILQRPAAK